MPVPRVFLSTNRWTSIDRVLVLEVKDPFDDDGDVKDNKWEMWPQNAGESIEVRPFDGLLFYRITDSAGEFTDVGAWPLWMVVKVQHTP